MTSTPTVQTPTPAAEFLTDAPRHDGWTPERQVAFLEHLADHGLAADAAKAAGMGLSGAYALRRRRSGVAFDYGWQAALMLARHRLIDAQMARALNGDVFVTTKEDNVTTRIRPNHRLAQSLIQNHDPVRACPLVRRISHNFDEFLQLILRGGGIDDIVQIIKRAGFSSFHQQNLLLSLPLSEESGLFGRPIAEKRAGTQPGKQSGIKGRDYEVKSMPMAAETDAGGLRISAVSRLKRRPVSPGPASIPRCVSAPSQSPLTPSPSWPACGVFESHHSSRAADGVQIAIHSCRAP
jgi:hypothetical protein